MVAKLTLGVNVTVNGCFLFELVTFPGFTPSLTQRQRWMDGSLLQSSSDHSFFKLFFKLRPAVQEFWPCVIYHRTTKQVTVTSNCNKKKWQWYQANVINITI